MDINYFYNMPIDILDTYIWPNISNKIKMLLNHKYYKLYHNDNYSINTEYICYIIKNNINIALDSIFLNHNFYKNYDKNFKKKIIYNNKIFYNYCTLYLYLCKKYNNAKFYNYYINNIKLNRQLSIKEYKKYTDKNIIWMK